jgi:NADH-quinone oxidoreductase subunit N
VDKGSRVLDLFSSLTLPELTIAVSAVAVILLDLFISRKGILAAVSIAGLILAAIFSLTLWDTHAIGRILGGNFTVDYFAVFFKLLITGIAILVILATTDYVSKLTHLRGEYYALILTSALGLMIMAAGAELITIYVGLELASISLYALSGFLKDRKSSESALKYLLLGAIASAVLLYGMALVFGMTGQTSLLGIAQAVGQMSFDTITDSPAFLFGLVLMISGFGFKIAAVPFHMWVPDVYEGAPTPITAYLSVASKAAGFAVILRVFYTAFSVPDNLSLDWGMIFAVLAAVSMTLGNVAAIPQSNIKRMLGYSSIAQAGYLMVGLATAGVATATDIIGRSGVLFFLAGYSLTNLGAFIAIIVISNKVNSDLIQDFAGMGRRAPLVAAALTLCLISLIGIPPAVGFMGKFYIFSGAARHGLLWLVIIAVINSVISAYYYLRVVKVMWFNEPASPEKVPSSVALRFALGLTSLGVLAVGIAPGWLMKIAETAAKMVTW